MRYLKRSLERKVNRAEHKRARLEKISSILRESFVDLEDCSSSNDESQSGNSTTQETGMQEDCTAATSSNLDVLCKQDKKEYKDSDRSENINDDGYDDNFNESNYSSDDVDLNDSNGDYSSNNSNDSDDSRSTTSTNSNQDPNHDQIELYFETEEEKETYLIEVLRIWALESGLLSMRKLDSLLIKLKPLFPNIPLSYKTLLDTPSSI